MNSTREGNVLFQMICLGLTGIFLSVSVIGEKSDVSRYDLNDILNALPTTVWGMVNLVKEKLKGTLPLPESKRCDNATNFTDCADLRRRGYVESNRVYSIWPRYLNEPIKVVCDMDTEGGGWTIIQRRGYYDDKPQEFNQSWYQYSVGFGSLNDDFWLGNDKIFAITNHKEVELRVDLEDFSGTKVYAKFSYFVVLSDLRNYQMFFGSYSGDAERRYLDFSDVHKEMAGWTQAPVFLTLCPENVLFLSHKYCHYENTCFYTLLPMRYYQQNIQC
ncbi:techylectin-5A-like isoform X5 [Limulus polyphemus]|uniref:Techylectin-5A-like isoform X5 n=1 Tax=Limulus polyphemus TaxID=6850 RepID=A0ABM1RV14_LIMPO|nr:techylectin-5A-like isoform X5 [Limulus polyphemus]